MGKRGGQFVRGFRFIDIYPGNPCSPDLAGLLHHAEVTYYHYVTGNGRSWPCFPGNFKEGRG